MTMKLILTGLKRRLKVYAGIALLYLLYALLSALSEPTPQMDNILDWFTWSYEIFGVKIYAMAFMLLMIAAAALLLAEIIMVARDFYSPRANLLISLSVNGRQVIGSRLGLFVLGFGSLRVLRRTPTGRVIPIILRPDMDASPSFHRLSGAGTAVR